LSNPNLFSKFLHCWKAYEICYKAFWYYPPHFTHVATLPWEIINSSFLHADIQQIWKKMQINCILSAPILIPLCVQLYGECIYVFMYLLFSVSSEYLKYLSVAIFFDKMWWLWEEPLVIVSASARSDVPLLWRRLVVVAPTRQWLRRWLSAECSTKSQWGAAWGQLCHALQSCKLVPAWDPIHGSRPG